MDTIFFAGEAYTTRALGCRGETYHKGDTVKVFEQPWSKDFTYHGLPSEINNQYEHIYLRVSPTYPTHKKYYALLINNKIHAITLIVNDGVIIDDSGRIEKELIQEGK